MSIKRRNEGKSSRSWVHELTAYNRVANVSEKGNSKRCKEISAKDNGTVLKKGTSQIGQSWGASCGERSL